MVARKRKAQVALGAGLRILGELTFTRDGARQFSGFAYSPAWLESRDRFQLSPGLELVSTPHFANGKDNARDALHGPFADVAPDS